MDVIQILYYANIVVAAVGCISGHALILWAQAIADFAAGVQIKRNRPGDDDVRIPFFLGTMAVIAAVIYSVI